MIIRTYPFVVPYRPVYGYVVLLVALLAMAWENAQNNAAIVEGAIPVEAIRLRILANSDSAPDQAVKRHVRNAVARELERLVAGAGSPAEARAAIAGALPELEAMVKRELEARGFGYGAGVKLGPVPFPAKIYGGRVYPAGEYEALLITLGKGRGENWWCVLFPPLCFADAVGGIKPQKGEAVPAGAAESGDSGGKTASAQAADHAQDGGAAGDGRVVARDVEVKFAVWELLQRILDFFRRLFG